MHYGGRAARAPVREADVPQEGGRSEGPLGPAQPAEVSRTWGASAEGGRTLAPQAPRVVTSHLVCGVGGRGLGHQQVHHGIPSLGRLAVPRGHGERHLLGGDPQLPRGKDRPIRLYFEVQAVGLIPRPLGPQTAAERDCKWKERQGQDRPGG